MPAALALFRDRGHLDVLLLWFGLRQ